MANSIGDRQTAWLLIGAVSAITVAVYWIGLGGPFLLDDQIAMKGVRLWEQGRIPLERLLLNNSSWLTHRALAMGSFALNAWLLGLEPFGFKLGNLLLHLASGVVGFGWLAAMLRRDPVLGPRARLAAALIVSVWLLHPLHVSTVLYVVQRMAQWATLCSLAGMWLYVVLRERIEARPSTGLWLGLYAGIASLTLLGIQGKQNAACLPILCLVIELAYFRSPRTWRWPLWVFYILSVFAPLTLGTALFLSRPELLGYGDGAYPFTPFERVLTEGRVLCDYLRLLLVPYTPTMGLATDTFAASTGIFAPPSTALAWLFIGSATALAWKLRTKWPGVLAGWGIFLVGHGIEGSFFGLELYYEHRNYLPAFGIFLACAAIMVPFMHTMRRIGLRPVRIGIVAFGALLVVLAVQTHGRSRVWSDMWLLAESDLHNRPDSVRAVVVYLELAVTSGDTARAYQVIEHVLSSSTNPQQRALSRLFKIRADCAASGHAQDADLRLAAEEMPQHVDVQTLLIYDLVDGMMRGGCKGISQRALADSMATAADRAAAQADAAQPKWFLRYHAAYLYAEAGLWPEALTQAELSWQTSTNTARAPLLVATLVKADRIDDAREILNQAIARAYPGSTLDAKAINRMREMIKYPRAEIDLKSLVGD
jgi:hypothetical protein